MAQDAVDHARFCNKGDDLHPGAAFADKRVNFKDLSEQARPGAPGFPRKLALRILFAFRVLASSVPVPPFQIQPVFPRIRGQVAQVGMIGDCLESRIQVRRFWTAAVRLSMVGVS
jgi:hypothetical protein